MTGLTNDFLEKISSTIIGKKMFLGVFSANVHPKIPKRKTFCLIFNTGKASTPGEHFVALFVTKTKVFYFDSFGQKSVQQDIDRFIFKTKKICVRNCTKIQDKTSNFCGLYSLAFLLWMKKNKPIGKFYAMFKTRNLKHNDNIVTKFILKEIK